ncbi:MAG: hypothetical protein JSS48_15690 [Nitrospira sp.]|nr:hypothetical protein [Nitrospira sp.]
MVRISKFLSVLLLALWLPATQHCALEAAGALITTCADHCTTGEPTGKDACGSIEDGSYRLAGDTLKVPAPDLFACACFLCLHLEAWPSDNSLSQTGDASSRVDVWLSTWQFVRRAAPLPGAPSPLVA